MPAIPIIAAVGTVAGAASTVKGMVDANKASKQAANAPAPTVNIAALDQQARDIAYRNAAEGAALQERYNPGIAQLRGSSMQAILDGLERTPETERLSQLIMAQAGQPLSRVGDPALQQFDSALTRQAAQAAAADLALGGQLPQDVRNLVARKALARSGTTTGGLELGRDLTTRDLGLTSLDLQQRRLQNAAAIGAQEAALEQGNAALRQAQQQGLLQAAGLNLTGEQFGRTNLFDSASFINNLNSGDFSRALAAGQFAQNIAMPQTGLDPGSVANLAVGNSNAVSSAAQQAAAIKAAQANQVAQFGGQLIGAGIGGLTNYYGNKNAPVVGYTAPGAPSYYGGGTVGNFGFKP